MGTDYRLVDLAARESLYIDRAGCFFTHSIFPPERVPVSGWGPVRVVTPANITSAHGHWKGYPPHIMEQGRTAFRWLDERPASVASGSVILLDDSSAEDEMLDDRVRAMLDSGELKARDMASEIDNEVDTTVGKLSEIPKLRAVLAEKTAKLRAEARDSSDPTGLTQDLDEKSILRRCPWAARAAIIPQRVGLFCVVAYADSIIGPNDDLMRSTVRGILRDGYSHLIPMLTSPDVRITNTGSFDSLVARIRSGLIEHRGQLVTPGAIPVHHNEKCRLPAGNDRPSTRSFPDIHQHLIAQAANASGLIPPDHEFTYVEPANAAPPSAETLIAEIHSDIDGILGENERLSLQLAQAQAELRRRTTRYNPATCRDEPWDPIATLDEIRTQVPRERRFEGYTLAGAVKEMAKALAEAEKRPTSAEIDAALADVLLKQAKLEPGMLVALRAGEDTDPKILRRMAEALNKALTDRFGSMTYSAPTVLMLPPDASMETVSTSGRGPVKVNVHEGRKPRPTDIPPAVARIYAEAAAASFGVTPEVVQAKRNTRRACGADVPCPFEIGDYVQYELGGHVVPVDSIRRRGASEWVIGLGFPDGVLKYWLRFPDAGVNAAGAPCYRKVSAPMPRGERRTIGRDIIAYDDPSDLMCADADPADGEHP